jgi:hypothetical protein
MIRRRSRHLLFVTLAALAVVTWFRAVPLASGPIGVYALIDKVVFEPNDTAPDRVQIWGVFVLADRQQSRGRLSGAGLLSLLPAARRWRVARGYVAQ